MAVIINDFEVVVEPPTEREEEAVPASRSEVKIMNAHDVYDIMRFHAERSQRIRAH
jgi:hypothetical protein